MRTFAGGAPQQIAAANNTWQAQLIARPELLLPRALAATAVFSAIAMAYPQVDVEFSKLFFDPHLGFYLKSDPYLLWLRKAGRVLPALLIAGMAIVLVLRLAGVRLGSLPNDRGLLFLSSALAIGPGLLVNAILKSYWGRPRPEDTTYFGGDGQFTVAWWPWGECTSNCSFVSGEASTAIFMMALVALVPARWRLRVLAAAIVWTLAISLNRIAFGAHFLSDVLISWTLTLAVIGAAYTAVYGYVAERVKPADQAGWAPIVPAE